MTKEELVEFLKENLKIETETASYYTGGMCDGNLYKDSLVIRLVLCDETISEVVT